MMAGNDWCQRILKYIQMILKRWTKNWMPIILPMKSFAHVYVRVCACTFMPFPRLSSELMSRPSLQACRQEITFWVAIFPGRIVKPERLPRKYCVNRGVVTSPPVNKHITNHAYIYINAYAYLQSLATKYTVQKLKILGSEVALSVHVCQNVKKHLFREVGRQARLLKCLHLLGFKNKYFCILSCAVLCYDNPQSCVCNSAVYPKNKTGSDELVARRQFIYKL